MKGNLPITKATPEIAMDAHRSDDRENLPAELRKRMRERERERENGGSPVSSLLCGAAHLDEGPARRRRGGEAKEEEDDVEGATERVGDNERMTKYFVPPPPMPRCL